MESREKHLVPPYCNTGVQNTEGVGLSPCVDWVQVTFKNVESPQKIAEILGLQFTDFRDLDKGGLGYKNALGFMGTKTLRIFFNGNENMGMHLEMTGTGCRQFEIYSSINWYELFYRLRVEHEASFSRLDLALDDFKGYFKIPNLIRRLKSNTVTSRFKKATVMENIIINSGETVGHTLYFGSPTSDIRIRMYEKNVESEVDIDVWNRTEVQMRDERADTVAFLIAHDSLPVGDIICGVLRNYIQFRVKNTKDSNKSRWEIAKFWTRFLDNAKSLKITIQTSKTSIEKKYIWIDTQVSKSFHMVYHSLVSEKEREEFILDTITHGGRFLNESDYEVITRFKEKGLTYEELKEVLYGTEDL